MCLKKTMKETLQKTSENSFYTLSNFKFPYEKINMTVLKDLRLLYS